MAIITKPGSILKGSGATITLNKSQLAALAPVAADAYYSDSTNWSKVHIKYKSSTSSQFELLKFDATVASPEAEFLVSDKANDVFNVDYIDIFDFDNGVFRVEDSSLNSSEFEIDMGSVTPPVSSAPIAWVNLSADVYNIEADGGLTNGINRGVDTYYNVYSNTQIATAGGDIDITFNIGNFPNDTAFGFLDASESGPNTSTPTFCGIVAGGVASRPHINSVMVAGVGDASNKIFRITRISGVVTMYLDNIEIYTTSVATTPNIKPVASLAFNGSLISSSVII